MTEQQLISLLQRYMDGLTSVDEEEALGSFLSQATDDDRPEAIPVDDWRAYREMFAMFAPETSDVPQATTVDDKPRRHTLRRMAIWTASAAAVALLLFAASTQLQRNTDYTQPLAQHNLNTLPVDSMADSISAEQPRRIGIDSIKPQPVKKEVRRTTRPYWQPRPPKVYVADADNSSTAHADSTNIEEAIRQADILLQAISIHQSTEMKQLELQAMEIFAEDDAEDDMAQ